MRKDDINAHINFETGLNDKANAFETHIRSFDSDAQLMSQRMAVANNPSGLIRLDSANRKDH